jgi:hypothetical protein
VTPFRSGQDVAAVEHHEEHHVWKPVEHGQVLYATVTEAGPCSVVARFGDEDERLFLLDSQGRAWRDSGRMRLVPLCARPDCEKPVTGTPVADPGDPMHRTWCSDGCRTASGEAYDVQHYGAR